MATTKTTSEEKKVKITLPLTREKQDDVFVGVNGQTWQIKRGVEVEVPEVVYKVLSTSAQMDAIALNNIMKNASK